MSYDPVGFGGQYGYYHDFQGRYLLGHRYYDSYTGRFVTRDPIGYGGGINLYGFTGNNPVNRSDPSGFEPAIKGDPDDPTGLPRDDEGHWHGSTINPSVHDGTHEARRANAMRRSAVDVFFGALLAVVSPEGKLVEEVVDAVQEWKIARNLTRNKLQLAKRAAAEAKAAGSTAPQARQSTPNQMQTEVQREQAPPGIHRVDNYNTQVRGEKDHIHFDNDDGPALNRDGTWKHGGRILTNSEKEWISQHGWKHP